MFRPMRPIRPLRVRRPVGAPLVRGLVVGGAVYAAGRAARPPADGRPGWPPYPAPAPGSPGTPAAAPGPGAAEGASGPAPLPGPDLADKLTELGRMVRQGLLTPEEFSTAKALLLGA
ncbi:SHOCT domain-containing protein [Kitasatospora indigofera]|nr:SHOCT domain-containing protein [Kitasatospora indigofera]